MKTYIVETEAKEYPEHWRTPTYIILSKNRKEVRKTIENDGRGLKIISIREHIEEPMFTQVIFHEFIG